MKLKIKKIFTDNENGVIIILTLGLLALISLLTIAYVNLAIIDKKAAYNYNALHQARIIVQSTCQRAIALSASQLSQSSAKASDVYTYNTNQDSDGLAQLLETTVEGRTYNLANDYNASVGPHWQYIQNDDSDTIIGRFAYKVVADQGRIDPSATSYNYSTEDGSGISGRPGRDVGEIKLNAIGSWFNNNETNLTKANEERWNSFDSIFDELSVGESVQDSYKTLFVLDDEPDPEAFWSDNGDLQRESSELLHRFNLARNDWSNIKVDSILSQPIVYNSSTSQSDIFSIPWLNNWVSMGDFSSVDSCRRQIAANLIDYNDADTIATTDNEDSPTYVGLEKCPYINELRLEIEGEVQAPSNGGGNPFFAGGDLSIYSSSLQLNNCNGHTNGDLDLSGGSFAGSGTFTYAGSLISSGGIDVASLSFQSSPVFTDLSDYKLNAAYDGNVSIWLTESMGGDINIWKSSNYYNFNNYITTVDNGSIIYVSGNNKNISISSSFSRTVTLISENGDVNISSGVSLTPAFQDILIYAGKEVVISGWSTYNLNGYIIGDNNISITPGGSVNISDAYIWSNGDIDIDVFGSVNISNTNTTTEESGDYVCNVYLQNAQLELVDMYGVSKNTQAEVTIDGSYNWIFDGTDSEVNFSKNFVLNTNAGSNSYSTSSAFSLADSDMSPITTISSAGGLTTSIEDFQISNLKVKLMDSSSNLLDFSYIVDSEYVLSVPEQSGFEVDGDLNINPGSVNGNHPFIMQTPGGEINIDDLRAWSVSDTYSGTATEIKIQAKRKGQGGTSLTINGETVYLHSGTYYTFTGAMTVSLYNPHSNGQAEGNWWIDISGSNVSIDPGFFSENDNSSSFSSDGSNSTIYLNFQVGDPRQNLLQDDWTITTESTSNIGSENPGWIPNGNGVDSDIEDTSATPWNISTSYIRNAPMQSPWELGLIHRGAAFQTLNLKKYNMSEGMRGGGNSYSDGDANIFDQIKMTSENFVYGKININTEFNEILKALYEDIPVGSDVDIPGAGDGTPISTNNAETLSNDTITANSSLPFYTRAQVLRPNRTLNEEEIKGVSQLYDGTYFTQENDAKQEEVVGKFINLTKAVAPNEYTIIVVAQAIKDIGGVTINNVACQTGRYDEGGDLILATQKILVIARWDEDSKRFRIIRYQYIDD